MKLQERPYTETIKVPAADRPRAITRRRYFGVQPFPLDMLRYDACWPTSQEDTVRLRSSRHGVELAVRDGLRGVTVSTWRKEFTEARWNSFGWYSDPARVPIQ